MLLDTLFYFLNKSLKFFCLSFSLRIELEGNQHHQLKEKYFDNNFYDQNQQYQLLVLHQLLFLFLMFLNDNQ